MSLRENSFGDTLETNIGVTGNLSNDVMTVLEDLNGEGAVQSLHRSAIHKAAWALFRVFEDRQVHSPENTITGSEPKDEERVTEGNIRGPPRDKIAKGVAAMRAQLEDLTSSDMKRGFFDSCPKGSSSQREEADRTLKNIPELLKSKQLHVVGRYSSLLTKALLKHGGIDQESVEAASQTGKVD